MQLCSDMANTVLYNATFPMHKLVQLCRPPAAKQLLMPPCQRQCFAQHKHHCRCILAGLTNKGRALSSQLGSTRQCSLFSASHSVYKRNLAQVHLRAVNAFMHQGSGWAVLLTAMHFMALCKRSFSHSQLYATDSQLCAAQSGPHDPQQPQP